MKKKDVQIYKKIIGQISNRMQYFAILIIKAESIKIKIKHFDEIGGSGQAQQLEANEEMRRLTEGCRMSRATDWFAFDSTGTVDNFFFFFVLTTASCVSRLKKLERREKAFK